MEYEFIIVTLISSICGLGGLVYLSHRKDRRSDIQFERSQILKQSDSKIKMKEARTRHKLKTIIESPAESSQLEELISKYAPLLTGEREANREDQGMIQGFINNNPELVDGLIERFGPMVMDRLAGKDEEQKYM